MNWGVIATWVQLITRPLGPHRLRRPPFDLRQPPKPVAVESQTNALSPGPAEGSHVDIVRATDLQRLKVALADKYRVKLDRSVAPNTVEFRQGERMKNGQARTLVQVTGFLSLIARGLAGIPDHVREEADELRDKLLEMLAMKTATKTAEKDETLGDLPLSEFPSMFTASARFSLINHLAVRALRRCDRFNVPVISNADGHTRRAVEMIVMLTYKDETWLKENSEEIREMAMRSWL